MVGVLVDVFVIVFVLFVVVVVMVQFLKFNKDQSRGLQASRICLFVSL